MSSSSASSLSLAGTTSLTHTVGQVPAQSWDGNSVRDAGAMGSDRATRRSWVTAECLLQLGLYCRAGSARMNGGLDLQKDQESQTDLAPALFLASGDFCLPHQSFHLSNGFVHVCGKWQGLRLAPCSPFVLVTLYD